MNDSQNNNSLTEERRKFVRLNVNVEINYSVIPDEEKQQTESKNISAGGICMVAEQSLGLGNTLKLEIKLPEDPPAVQAKGRVVWVKKFIETERHQSFDVGIEFIDISEQDRKKIDKYVFSMK